MIILDASIIIKWFVEEKQTPAALEFKQALIDGKEIVLVPDLLIYEIINVLRFKKGVPESRLNEIIPSLFDIGLKIITPSRRLMQDAFHLSLLTGLSIYDASYLALASETEAPLITADESLARQAKSFVKIELL